MDQTCPTETITSTDYLRLIAHLQRGGAWGYWWLNAAGRKRSTWWPVKEPAPLPQEGGNLYFGVHPSAFIPERNDRGEAVPPAAVRSQLASIAAINALFSEFDAKDFGGDLDKTLAHIEGLPKPPSVLVCSGGGYHAYWLLAEPEHILDDAQRLRLRSLQAAWVRFTGGDPGAKDLARVLRLPGTCNYKYDPPRPVSFAWEEYRRLYRLAELEALLPAPVPLPTPRPNGHKPPARLTDQLVEAAALLKRLSPERCDNYDRWVEVGLALSELGPAGLALWEDWSKGSPKYQEGECAEKWPTFKQDGDGKPLRLGSLRHWAEKDDPGGGRAQHTRRSHSSAIPGRALPESNDATPQDDAPQPFWALCDNDPGLILTESQAEAKRLHGLGFSTLALCGCTSLGNDDLTQVGQRIGVYLAPGFPRAVANQLGPLALCLPPLPEEISAEDLREQLNRAETWLERCINEAKACPPNQVEERMIELGGLLGALPKGARPRYYRLAMNRLGLTRRELSELLKLARQASSESGERFNLSSVRDGQLCFLGEPLGNFAAWISDELTRENGMDTPTVEYTLHGQLADGPTLQAITIPAEQFASMDWIARYWGARPVLYIPRGKAYVAARAIQENSLPTLQQERVFTYTGWREIDGLRGYLTGSGFLTAGGLNEQVRVDLGGSELRHYALPAPPQGRKEMQEAIRASLDFLDLGPRSVTAPLWAAMFASVFTEIKALYTVLWVYGTTQSGKSTISHLALTHFGTGFINGRQYLPPENWESSLAALEYSMFTTKDAPLIIDDYAPQFASAFDAREMQRTAQKVIRRAGNRTARNRSRANLTQQVYRPPRGLVLVTAELPLSGESTAGRMLYIPVAPGDVLPEPGDNTPRPAMDQAQKQAEAGLYGQAMGAFLQWMAANWERATARFLEIIEESSAAARCQKVQNRLPDYYAILDAAQQVALTAFYELGVLSANQAADIAYQNGQAILDVVVNQAERIASESPVRKFFESLDSLLERQKVYLAPKTRAVSYVPPINADLIGYFDPGDEGVVYLSDDACLEHVREYWAKLGENFDTTKDALRRQISQIPGLLARRGGREILVKTWIAAKNCSSWTLAIDRQRLEALYQVELKNRETLSLNLEQAAERADDDV